MHVHVFCVPSIPTHMNSVKRAGERNRMTEMVDCFDHCVPDYHVSG
uniref:Uncharacterized protein n=1 Tax=Picea glauca TaxID=3330 RepID=A0A124GNL0_PICGL|nr:hypothetical protein ABT39_MTgene3710 [Picea glauca]